jgi:ligand-binding sensor domain-containing protein
MTILSALKTNAANPEWMFLFPEYVTTAFMDDVEFMWIGTNNHFTYKVDKLTQKKVDSIKANAWDIAKDKVGIVWIASNSGLIKYDGVKETRYRTDNSGIPYNTIGAIKIDKNNVKWIATNGLVKFDGVNWTVYNTKNSGIPADAVSSIAIDKDNVIWIGTYNNGLAKFDGTNWITYNVNNSGLSSNYIETIIFDKTGNLWIGTDDGLTTFDGVNWKVYNTTNSKLPDNVILKIAIDSSNNIWLGSSAVNHYYGLIKFDNVNFSIFNTSNSDIKSDGIDAIIIDNAGNKWIGVSSTNDSTTGVCIFKEGGVILNIIEVNNKSSNSLQLYPNPSNDIIKIMNYEISDDTEYSLQDITGKEIQKGSLITNEILVDRLVQGVYYIYLKDGRKTKCFKILKN